jgi:hypothetical protein
VGKALLLAIALVLVSAQPALAHDCSSPADCEQTAGYNAVIALAGGVLALAAGLFGNAIGGGGTPADQAGDTGASDTGVPHKKRRGCCLWWFTMLVAGPLALIAVAVRASGLLGG